MLLHESRRNARVNEDGDIVLLEDQDRSLWDRNLIEEGSQLLQSSLRTRRIGTHTIQAAISAVHAEAERASETDWSQIVALYDVLLRIQPSPVVELNRAVAIAMRDTPAEGIKQIEAILDAGHLRDHYLAHSARGELLRRMGKQEDAIQAFEQALSLAMNAPEQRFLSQKLAILKDAAGK
jgi:RNA polymerase sigma-70 factor (ECF subfamily)